MVRLVSISGFPLPTRNGRQELCEEPGALSPDVSSLSLAPPRALAAAVAVCWVWGGLLHHIIRNNGEILHLIAQIWGSSQCGTGKDSYFL